MSDDKGGDSPCWAHLLDDAEDDAPAIKNHEALVADLGTESEGPSGAVWSLPHGGDLDANLVRLAPGMAIDSHVNNEVDVLLFVRSGVANLTTNGQTRCVGVEHLALIAKGTERSIQAGDEGVTYLSVHRRRGLLGITPRIGEERR